MLFATNPFGFGPNWATDLRAEALPVATFRALFREYERLRDGRALPVRRDFDPREVTPVLPWLVLFDVEEQPVRYKVRLQGTGVAEAVGGDATGQYLDEIDGTEEACERLDWARTQKRPYLVTGGEMSWSPMDYKTYSALVLPFAVHGEDVDLVMTALSFDKAMASLTAGA